MKNQIKSFLLGAAVTALLGGLVVSSMAISGQMTITVDPINIQVNGQVFQPKDPNGKDVPVFQYEGTTYAPLRALAEAYGLEVGYDAASNLATVVDPDKASSNNISTGDISGNSNKVINEDGRYVDYEISKMRIFVNGEEITSDSPIAILANGTNVIDVNLILKHLNRKEMDNQSLMKMFSMKYIILNETLYTSASLISEKLNIPMNYDLEPLSVFFSS